MLRVPPLTAVCPELDELVVPVLFAHAARPRAAVQAVATTASPRVLGVITSSLDGVDVSAPAGLVPDRSVPTVGTRTPPWTAAGRSVTGLQRRRHGGSASMTIS